VPFAGGGEALAALLGNQVAAGISGYGEFSEQVKAGSLRILAISSGERQEGIDAPTLKEQGIDIELFNWRGVFAPPGVADEDKAAMVKLVETMAGTTAWADEVKKRSWTPILLTGDDYAKFLAEDTARVEGILKDLGLA
jgi:putative tricarboxylic transport membrane protein